MRATKRAATGAALATVAVLLAAACSSTSPTAGPPGSGGTAAPRTRRPGPNGPGTTAPIAGAPAELASHGDDWVLPGHDYDNSRSTFTAHLDSTNIADLSEAWRVDLAGTLTTVPLIVGDTVYAQDGSGQIVAVDRATGAIRWKTAPYGMSIGPYGVAVADGRVYAVHGSTGVVAVDAATGKELWTRDITATPTTGIDIQPTVFDGTVLVSTVPVSAGGVYTAGDRGVITALDAATGAVRWTFDTVQGDLWGPRR